MYTVFQGVNHMLVSCCIKPCGGVVCHLARLPSLRRAAIISINSITQQAPVYEDAVIPRCTDVCPTRQIDLLEVRQQSGVHLGMCIAAANSICAMCLRRGHVHSLVLILSTSLSVFFLFVTSERANFEDSNISVGRQR